MSRPLIRFSLTLAIFLAANVASAESRNPVLFVHGFASGGYFFNTMTARFEQAGYRPDELFAITYDTNQSNRVTAGIVADKVEEILESTKAEKVDIVSHSMGGLSTRYYLKFLGGHKQVESWVSMAGPNHGTDWAYGCWFTSCLEMRPGSTFLEELNQGHEVVGKTRYGTFWSPCDEVINPNLSTAVKGAENYRTECIAHNWFGEDRLVFENVVTFIQ